MPDIPAMKGHRLFAALWDRIAAPAEQRYGKEIRPRIMGEVQGRVLEIGIGTGASFSYYPAEAQVVVTEPDPYMLGRAEKRLEELGLGKIELRLAPGEELPFDDASFDHVVTCWVLCHVEDQPRALTEARRLLKPDGTFRFIEHVRNDDSRFWGTFQDVVNPLWRRMLNAGCRLNRPTRRAIEDAGFHIEWLERVRGERFMPIIYGVARPG